MAMVSFGHPVHHQDAKEKPFTKTNTYNRKKNKATKRKNSDEEEVDSDQAYLERYKKNQRGNSKS